MSHVTALQIRQSLGKILKQLQGEGKPIIIEKGRAPVAVLISLDDYEKRFLEYQDPEKQAQLLTAFRESGVKTSKNSLTALRKLRYGSRD